jgi:transcriptional regulator with XRE-family HTH domain
MAPKRHIDPDFAERLRLFLDTLHPTNRQVALSVGISSSALSAVLAGKSYLHPEHLRKLHDLYGLNLNWLLSGTGPMIVSKDNANAMTGLVAWDVDGLPEDAALESAVVMALRDEMRKMQEHYGRPVQIGVDQFIGLRFLLVRMAIGLGRPPAPLIIRRLIEIAQGPDPEDLCIIGRAAESASPYSGASPDKKDGR